MKRYPIVNAPMPEKKQTIAFTDIDILISTQPALAEIRLTAEKSADSARNPANAVGITESPSITAIQQDNAAAAIAVISVKMHRPERKCFCVICSIEFIDIVVTTLHII